MKKVLVTGILITTLCIAGCGGPVDNIKDATGLSKMLPVYQKSNLSMCLLNYKALGSLSSAM